jgi:hypothetical protein
MNETDFIRQQLSAERAHLREILEAVRQDSGARRLSRPVKQYIEWASRRLVTQLRTQLAALQAAGAAGPALGPDMLAKLEKISTAVSRCGETSLLESLASWGDALDVMAAKSLRIGHWRAAAQLTADTILEERQLYGAARAAAGPS